MASVDPCCVLHHLRPRHPWCRPPHPSRPPHPRGPATLSPVPHSFSSPQELIDYRCLLTVHVSFSACAVHGASLLSLQWLVLRPPVACPSTDLLRCLGSMSFHEKRKREKENRGRETERGREERENTSLVTLPDPLILESPPPSPSSPTPPPLRSPSTLTPPPSPSLPTPRPSSSSPLPPRPPPSSGSPATQPPSPPRVDGFPGKHTQRERTEREGDKKGGRSPVGSPFRAPTPAPSSSGPATLSPIPPLLLLSRPHQRPVPHHYLHFPLLGPRLLLYFPLILHPPVSRLPPDLLRLLGLMHFGRKRDKVRENGKAERQRGGGHI